MPECTVHLWIYRFREMWENIRNDETSGRLSDSSTNEMRHAVLAVLECDQKFTIGEIQDLLVDERSIEVSHMNVQHILARVTQKCVQNGYPNS